MVTITALTPFYYSMKRLISLTIDNDNVLLRGTVLRNCEEVVGVCVYAGAETKLMKNGGEARFKRTQMDIMMNTIVLGTSFILSNIEYTIVYKSGVQVSLHLFQGRLDLPATFFGREHICLHTLFRGEKLSLHSSLERIMYSCTLFLKRNIYACIRFWKNKLQTSLLTIFAHLLTQFLL